MRSKTTWLTVGGVYKTRKDVPATYADLTWPKGVQVLVTDILSNFDNIPQSILEGFFSDEAVVVRCLVMNGSPATSGRVIYVKPSHLEPIYKPLKAEFRLEKVC